MSKQSSFLTILSIIVITGIFLAYPMPGNAGKTIAYKSFSKQEQQAVQTLIQTVPRLRSTPVNLANKDHANAFAALMRVAEVKTKDDTYTKTIKQLTSKHKKSGIADPGLVYLVDGKKYNYEGEASEAEIGPVQAITSFENTDPDNNTFGVSGLVSLPNPNGDSIVTCTHTLQVFDEQGNPQGNADVVTQQLACENVQLHAEGTLDSSDQWAEAVLTTTWTNNSGPQTPLVMRASGSRVPTSIVSIDPNDKNGDGMIKFCFGRNASDCDYKPSGSSKKKVKLPIQGSTTYAAALVDPTTDPNASVSISITQPTPAEGGGCNLVADVSDFMDTVTLSNNDQTVNWDDTSVSFPAIDSSCMPNGSIVYYNMSMNVDLAGDTPVPTFFGISSSPDTPVSTGYYLQLEQTRVYYSCLAADTLVTLADGSKLPIAELTEGYHKVTGANGELLNIKSVYNGEEDELIELLTDNGIHAKVTAGHPVITPSGPQLARFLTVGDAVITESGMATLTKVNRIAYHGKVYNLALVEANPNPMQSVSNTNGSAFYGNGLLVGDNEMQWLYDRGSATTAALKQPTIKTTISEQTKALIESRSGQPIDPERYIVR